MLGTRPVVVRLLVGVGCVCDLILERVWELADAGGENGRVGYLELAVIGAHRHVGQADFEHPGIEYPTERS